jgi:hypothetical protein
MPLAAVPSGDPQTRRERLSDPRAACTIITTQVDHVVAWRNSTSRNGSNPSCCGPVQIVQLVAGARPQAQPAEIARPALRAPREL